MQKPAKYPVPPGHKIIPGYERYAVSEAGDSVVSLISGKPLTQCNSNGYKIVGISNREERRNNCFVHILVARAWLPPPADTENMVVNHKDLNKANNHASNLEWVTRIENARHAVANSPHYARCRFSPEDVKFIRKYYRAQPHMPISFEKVEQIIEFYRVLRRTNKIGVCVQMTCKEFKISADMLRRIRKRTYSAEREKKSKYMNATQIAQHLNKTVRSVKMMVRSLKLGKAK